MAGSWGLRHSSGDLPEWRAGPSSLAGAEIEAGGTLAVPWGFGPGDWGSLSGGPVTYLFYHVVWVVLAPIGTANVVVNGWSREDDKVSGFGWQSGL